MMTWLSANLINIVLIAALALVMFGAIRGIIRDKKAGKSSCGCSCASCGMCGKCGAASGGASRVQSGAGR